MDYGTELQGPVIRRHWGVEANVVIFPELIIRKNAIVGAGAVVNNDVLSRDTVVSNPARSVSGV